MYIEWATPNGPVYITMPVINSNTIRIDNYKQNDKTVSTFLNEIKTKSNIDITQGDYIADNWIPKNINEYSYNLLTSLHTLRLRINAGDVWTSGTNKLKWVWYDENKKYLKGMMNDKWLTYYVYLDGGKTYPSEINFQLPFFYSATDKKIIFIPSANNFVGGAYDGYVMHYISGSTTDTISTDFNRNNPTVKEGTKPNDPYNTGGNTNVGGGGGTFGGGNTIFGGASDSIDIPPLPTASASSAGFITLFNPSLTQLNNLATYMWSDLFSLDTFKKIFADPMDCILGLSIVPVKPASAGTSTVKIGNVSTDISMNKTSSQYVAVDCGTIDVKEYWGAYLDYAPYTQCEIYLPYVGTKQISVDDVMNKAVHVVYHVDILSGACNAYVKCGDSVLYTFVGQCSSSIPISGNDWTNVLNGAISVAGKIGLAMATGGATALMSGLGAASSIISSSKPTVERSGAMSSTGGLLGIQKPYLILTRPKQALPENQNKYTGYPSFITMALSDCTGYTEIDSVHLENMTCTDEEAQEIENLLKSGVIF